MRTRTRRCPVLATDDDAADRVADLQAEADKARAAAGVTDAAVAAKDEEAQKLREAVQSSVAKKQAAKAKGKRSKNEKTKTKPQQPAGLNASPDLTNASQAEVEEYQHKLEKAMALTPNLDDRLTIAREQENAQTTAQAAGRREQYESFMRRASDQRSDNEFLKRMVYESNQLRESTSVWVEAPIHFWGGAWTRIEIPEFAMTNGYLNQAEAAAKAGRLDEANELLDKSWGEWWDLNHRFEKYAEGIQKGGERVVRTAKLVERINRGAANLNPALGFVYNFAQDSLQQRVEVSYGQRKSVDYWGNLKNSAVNTVVNKVAAGGSSFAGEAASPLLSNLGPFAGFGRQVVEQGTGILISSELTGTSVKDAVTDPTTFIVPLIGGGYAHGGEESPSTDESTPEQATPDALPPAAASLDAIDRTSSDVARVSDATAGPDRSTSTLEEGRTPVDSAAAATEDVSVAAPESVSRPDVVAGETPQTAAATGNEAGLENSTRVDDPLSADETSAGDKSSEGKAPDDVASDEKVTGEEIWSQINKEMEIEEPPARPAGKKSATNELVRIDDPKKSKGVLAEATVPFENYRSDLNDQEWNIIGGGSETASSRANLARRSSHDERIGQEGTAGNDYLMKNRKTKRLVIGEQKATKGDSFTKATAITSSLESNVARDIEVLEERVKSGEVEPAEVNDLNETIGQLKATLEALQKGAKGEPAQLPENVVFELTNIGGKGKQIGKEHIDLLAKRYGKNPEFLEHLLDRTSVRDPKLAKARADAKAEAEGHAAPKGVRGTDTDPDIVPAKDILTPEAEDTLERLRADKTEKQWKAQKARERKQRADAESAAREQARQAGEKARQERLKQLLDEKAQKNDPEPRTKREREQAARKLDREAKEAGKQAEKAEVQKFLETRKQQEAADLAARRAQQKAQQEANRQKREDERKADEAGSPKRETKKRAETKSNENPTQTKQPEAEAATAQQAQTKAQAAQQTIEAAKQAAAQEQTGGESKSAGQAKTEADKPVQSEKQNAGTLAARQAQEKAQRDALQLEIAAARSEAEQAKNETARAEADQSKTNTTEANKNEARGNEPRSNETNQPVVNKAEEGKTSSRTNITEQTGNAHENLSGEHSGQPHEGAGGKAVHAANQAAGAIRAYDAYQDALKEKKSHAQAALEAGKAYLASTNPVAGAVSTAVQRMQKDEKGEQYYGNDKLDAWLGTIGETGAGFVVPGEGWDQAVNAADNLTDAVDDHVQKSRDPKAPVNNKATLRTGADLAGDLTPSREFAQVIGAGTRAYYDLGRAAGGDTSGVDKFGEDATRGKLGSVIQPWAMAADFAGNLGNSTPSQALEKTIKKTEGTTLKKIGDAAGDAAFHLGQNKEAKAGKYGPSVQGIAGMLSMSNDMIAGKSFEQALNNAADQSKESAAAKVGDALGDAAFVAVQKGKEIINEDLPAAKKKAAEMIDQSKQKLSNWWKKL